MRSFMIPAALAVGVAAAAPASALMPAPAAPPAASGVTSVQYYYRHYHRHYRGAWVPHRLRGFADPGYAYHGNINGCAEDLGYGRWEPCDRGR